MSERAKTSRLITALALLLVLVVQSFVGASSLGATPQLDAFGNPLCLNGPDHDGSGNPVVPDHSKMPSCCTFACSMFWPGLAAPTNVGVVTAGLGVAARLSFAQVKPIDLHEQGYRPGNPRAPPLMA